MAMETERAAQLLEKWIEFYGMNERSAWLDDEWVFVQKTYEAMELAIQALRGSQDIPRERLKKAAIQLERWPQVYSMDDGQYWEAEDFLFVITALDAIRFASTRLKSMGDIIQQ